MAQKHFLVVSPSQSASNADFLLLITKSCWNTNQFAADHGADSSNESPDLHITQTPASEVHAPVVTEWPPACLQKLLPRA